ncbi:MAG: glycosyltransferase family 2 protein [Armatimonadota bacterium]
MQATVVIPTYNVISTRGERVLGRCLEGIRAQRVPPAEVIVADSSDDGTPEFIADHMPEATIIHSDERMLSGRARNVAAGAASGAIVAFIDSDCIPAPTWIEAIARGLAEHPQAYGLTGPVRADPEQNAVAQIDCILHLNHLARFETAQWASRASTSNLAVRREAFEALGGFPADVVGNPDYVFTKRLTERYGPIRVERDAAVYHQSRDSVEALLHHQRRFGHGFVDGRREDPTLPGAFALRWPWLIPLLPLMRGGGILARLARHNRGDLVTLLAHPVLFARALGAWARGIREGLQGEEIAWDMGRPAAPEHRPGRGADERAAPEKRR